MQGLVLAQAQVLALGPVPGLAQAQVQALGPVPGLAQAQVQASYLRRPHRHKLSPWQLRPPQPPAKSIAPFDLHPLPYLAPFKKIVTSPTP